MNYKAIIIISIHYILVLHSMNNHQESLPLLFRNIGMTKKEFKKINLENIRGLIIIVEARCCNPQSLQILRNLIDLERSFPLLKTEELPQYRKDFLTIMNLKIKDISTIECSELLFLTLACRHLDKACNSSSFIDEQTFDSLVSLIIQKTKKYQTEPLSLKICSLDASEVNKFIYTYNAFTPLDKKISTKFSLLNIFKKGINFFRKPTNQILLKNDSIFKNILETIQQFGFISNNAVYLGINPLMDIENVPYAKPCNRKDYIKECLKPTKDIRMNNSLRKRIETFLLCNKRQKKHLQIPKMLIQSYIIKRIHHETIANLKKLFIKDIERCKALNFSDGTNGATDFLYNDFEEWFNTEMNNL